MKQIGIRVLASSAAAVMLVASGSALASSSASEGGAVASGQPSTAAQDAQRAWQAQDYAAAAEALKQVVKEQPGNGQAWFRLGYALHVTGKLEEAIEAHKKAAEFPQGRPTALYNLGCAYALTGKTNRAFKALNASARHGMRNVALIEQDSDLASLHEDARWETYLETVREYAANAPEQLLGFWVGSWDCYNASSGNLAGTNTLAWRPGARVIHESWSSGGGSFTGESWNWYDAAKGAWKQVWVDQAGDPTEFIGKARDGGVLFEAKKPRPTGGAQWTRMFVRPIGDGWVRQTGTASDDEGATWALRYDLVYVPSGETFSAEKLAELSGPGEL